MAHIHTDPGQHDHTVTGYIVRTDTPEPRVLLHMHRKLHTLLPVGGHIELHETPWQAMVHELLEESGYSLDEAKILQPPGRIESLSDATMHPYPLVMNTHPIPDDHFHSDTAYGFVVTADPANIAEEGESLDFRWLTLNELRTLDQTEVFANTKEVYEFLLTTALAKWEQVSTSQYVL